MSGWIKLRRELSHHWVAQDPDALSVWIRILLEANYQNKSKRFNGSLVTIKRGQLIFGLNAFSDKTGVSVSKLRRIINDLEKDGMIDRQKTNKYSVITVISYDLYQSSDSQTTIKQQADDSQTATPKEGKKEKKERNIFIPPSLQEAQSYFNERNCPTYLTEAQSFIDFYEAKGWMIGKNKMKDWKASVRNWMKNYKAPIQPNQESFLDTHTDTTWAKGLVNNDLKLINEPEGFENE